MNILLAQIKLKTADFDFNKKNIFEKLDNVDADLIIFPQADIDDLGGKDLVLDEACRNKQHEFYQAIAEKNYKSKIFQSFINC